jgi:hypothetical protein
VIVNVPPFQRSSRASIACKTAESTARPHVECARDGATDLEIHATVLIAAVFCLCNRYVDGLATWAPTDPDFYRQRAALVAELGYTAATLRGQNK